MDSQYKQPSSFQGQGSGQDHYLGDASVPRSQLSVGGYVMDRHYISNQSTQSTDSWQTQMTGVTSESDTGNYDFISEFKSEPNLQYDTEPAEYMYPFGRPSPGTEQANALAGLSLYPPTSGPSDAAWSSGPLQAYHQQSIPEPTFQSNGLYSNSYSLSHKQLSSSSENAEPMLRSHSGRESYNQHRYGHEEEVKQTPKSLGWPRENDLIAEYLAKYNLKLRKSREPYFELKAECQQTHDTPLKVYFDQPKNIPKNDHPCLYPGECDRKGKPFSRPADLDRHLKAVHATSDQKDSFPCDYEKCSSGRHTEPFTRKDHYRDHLRDFHKEDIGACKGETRAKTEKDKKQWLKDQYKWLDERQIHANHWRCARCLVKKLVKEDGWGCMTCKLPCEQERIDARLRLPGKDGMETMQVDDEAAYQNFEGQTEMGCTFCAGSGYVDDGLGQWISCPECLYRQGQGSSQTWAS